MEELNNKVHNLAFDVAFLPLKCKINSMSALQVRMWQRGAVRIFEMSKINDYNCLPCQQT
jgi:hypothetical protein